MKGLYEFLFGLLDGYIATKLAQLIAYLLMLVFIAAVCFVVRWLVRGAVIKVASQVARRTATKWDDILLKHKVYHRAASMVVPVVLGLFASTLPQYDLLLHKIAQIAGVLVFMRVGTTLLGAVNEIYELYEISKMRPIRSLLQVLQVALIIVGSIVVVALVAGESPLVLLGGIGAATAVTSFIFKDAILGFVAGIQLTANDMIRIGDWIQVPGASADGTVTELTMTTVKVQNFDKTITSIPAYMLVSQAFVNWRGMQAAGGRRIKRAVYIDAADVRLCDTEMIERFRNIALLRGYEDEKLAEIDAYNAENGYDDSEPVNGRRMTNIGTLRAYIQAYLKQHPGLHPDMIMMVRQLEPDDRGLPLEIYAFTGTTVWTEYEDIQSDIFDHIYSIVSEFGLRVYQKPSGADVRGLGLGEK